MSVNNPKQIYENLLKKIADLTKEVEEELSKYHDSKKCSK